MSNGALPPAKVDDLINPTGKDSDRLVLFPIKHHDIWQMYKKAEGNFWTFAEAQLADDMKHWETLTDNERHYIKHILAFFASADGIVNENLVERMMSQVQYPEARSFYGFQIMIENIHCVSGDTKIYTDKGHLAIGKHVNRSVNVWNGHEWSPVTVRKTADEASFIRVTLSNGMELLCTDKHKWFIERSSEWSIDTETGPCPFTFTRDLKIGDQLRPWRYEALPDSAKCQTMDQAFTFGFVFGQKNRKKPMVTLDHLRALDFLTCEKRRDRYYCTVPPRYYGSTDFVPYNFSLKTRVDWISGVWQSCGRVSEGRWVFVVDHEERARSLQLLLTTFGLFSIRDGKSVSISPESAQILLDYGVYIDKPSDEPGVTLGSCKDDQIFITGLASGGSGESFCFEEPKRHAGVFNGILAGNSESYSAMIDTYIKDEMERRHLFESLENIPVIRKKADWALRWIQDEKATFGERLLAFACVEGIFFSGSFAAIYWLRSRGLMPGLAFLNDKIAADEGLHCEFACLLYRDHLEYSKPSRERAYQIVREACELEKEFQTEALPCTLIGLRKEDMSNYISYITDYLLGMIGLPKIYNVKNPFPFVETINLVSTTNFFERRNANYNVLQGEKIFDQDVDF